MDTTTVNQLKEMLTPVAAKIGETAEWGWAVVVKQMYVEAVLGGLQVLSGITLMVISFFVYNHLIKLFHKKEKENKGLYFTINDHKTEAWVSIVGFAFVYIPIITVGMITLITRLINPEFYAIQFFINLAK